MSRLTKRNADGVVTLAKGCHDGCEYLTCSMEEGYACNHQCEADCMCKLADYEDKEEQGLLIELPCKVGDTMYRIADHGRLKDTCETDCYSCNIPCPYEGREYERVFEIVAWEMVSVAVIVNAMEQLGKTVFLTRSEAEEALARMKGEDT